MGRWQPAIGDPSFMGWFTVAAYGACAILAAVSARAHRKRERRSFIFWSLVSGWMLLLAINKQLDLQSLVPEIGRRIAMHQGWMAQRRTVQFWFIVGFGLLSLAGFAGFVYALRDLCRRFRLAFIGLFFLLSFIILRAAGFHHVDPVPHFRFLNLKMNWLLELGGIFIISAAAIQALLHRGPSGRGRADEGG
jgi:hypothetical protein